MKLNVLTCALAFLICSCSSDKTGTDDIPQPEGGDGNDDEVIDPDPVILPEVNTLDISELLISYVKFNGELISEGDSPVTEIGFVIGTEEGVTIDSNHSKHSISQENSSDFTLTVYNIQANTEFFLRAYAVNADGVGYGNDVAFSTLADEVFNGNVYLETQEEVETFGEMGVTTIEGELTITGSVKDLGPLIDLERVTSGVDIIHTTELTTLEGLNNLTYTGYLNFNPIRIFSNSGMESLQGLNGLVNASGGIHINNMDLLEDLTGLENLSIVSGRTTLSLHISNCPNLTSMEGLEHLKSVRNLYVGVNPLLSDISALSNLTSIENTLTLTQCHSLNNLDGFQGITKLTELNISDNDGITNINELENIQEVSKILIVDNDVLINVSALGGITSTETLLFSHNDSLEDLSGIDNITFASALSIADNPSLKSLSGMETLKEVNELYVHRNESLENLDGLEGLIRITNNDSQQSKISIISNPNLASLSGLENIESLEEDLTITNNASLSDFCALEGLYQKNGPGGEVVIQDNSFNPTSEDISSGNCSQ